MATEQDWASYANQTSVATSDTFLARTSAGAGVEIPGDQFLAKRADGVFSAGGTASGDGVYLRFSNGSSAANSFCCISLDPGNNGLNSRDGQIRAYNNGSNAISLSFLTANGSAPVERVRITEIGVVRPGADNAQTMGTSTFRWSVFYAVTGTINTSDEREKEWRGAMTDAELRAAKRIAGELGFYRWLTAVAEKGDAARYHFGARAQRVWGIMADEGLVDPIVDGLPGATPYAFLCFDQWDETLGIPEQKERRKNGKIISPASPAVPAMPAGNRYGLRVDQLTLFLIAAQEQRLMALEAA